MTSPLHEAITFNQFDLVKECLKSGIYIDFGEGEHGPGTALHKCCANINSDIRILKMLLANGADVNATSFRGWNSLHYLCSEIQIREHFKVVFELLLKQDVKVNHQDKQGRTALMLASADRLGRDFKAKALIKAGANVDIGDLNGNCAIDYALNTGEDLFRAISLLQLTPRNYSYPTEQVEEDRYWRNF